MGVHGDAVQADADLSKYDLLIVGKDALTPEGPGPNLARVRDGLQVLVFEQHADVLEQRFGFRVQEYGLREVFPAHSRSSGPGRIGRGSAEGLARRCHEYGATIEVRGAALSAYQSHDHQRRRGRSRAPGAAATVATSPAC